MRRNRTCRFLIGFLSSFVLMLSACGGDGSGYAVDISSMDLQMKSGLVDGGATTSSTQILRGIVPSPYGTPATLGGTYDGKAYLVLNGQQIQVNVTAQAVQTSEEPEPDDGVEIPTRTIIKGRDEFHLDPKSSFTIPMQSKDGGAYEWIFEVTFSLNGGSNTLQIEVYDLNDTLLASSDQWDVVCAIEPSSMTVTLSWDTNMTDIDLWVANVDENGTVLGQACGWTNKTATDGDGDTLTLDYDDVNGYGPEHTTLDNASRSKKYAVKVSYFADHNTDDEGNPLPEPTPTTANVTAEANGEVKLIDSHLMTVAGEVRSWASGSHIWDVGTFEVTAPNRFVVDVQSIDTNSFPTVTLTVHVTDPSNTTEPNVEDLAQSAFYVINAGMAMSPVTVSGGTGGIYTLTYADITCGKRDLYVYVSVPAHDEELMKSGLSATKTYGKNYALLVGLNEYPPASPPVTSAGFVDAATIYVDCKPGRYVVTNPSAGDFTMKLTKAGQLKASVAGSSISDQGGGVYRVTFATPADYQDDWNYDVVYKYQAWLLNSINDINDMKTALLAKGTDFSNSAWESANIYTLTNNAATESAIDSKISDISLDMNACDLFLFHYSGHGSGMPTAGEAAQYLCAYEDENWISVNDLEDMLFYIPSPGDSFLTNIFVLIDACHSGNFIGKDMEEGDEAYCEGIPKYRDFIAQAEPFAGGSFEKGLHNDTFLSKRIFVMTAVQGDETALDVRSLNNGLFTYYLSQGMSVSSLNGSGAETVSGALANANNDCWITGEEAFNYCQPKSVAYKSTKIPQMYDNSSATLSRLIYNW